MSQRHLDPLSPDECFALMAAHDVGRLVYTDEKGPAAVPVNYVVDGGRVVFRVEDTAKVSALRRPIAFEVDEIDEGDHSGWSVLLRGTAGDLPMEEVVELLRRVRAEFPRPWAEGIHNQWMALAPSEVTGRRLSQPVDAG